MEWAENCVSGPLFLLPPPSVTQAATRWSIRCCSRESSTGVCKREWETVEKVTAKGREK